MDCAYNIITANFSGGKTHATTARVYQWSRGIELCITGADSLPQTFKAHFSVQKKGGVATTIVGIDERVTVPNVLFTIGKDIHVWLGASETEDDAEILYTVDIPVAPAPMPEYYDAEDTGVFDAVVEQVSGYAATATAAANSAGASATAAAGSASAAAAGASSAAGSAGAAEQARADAVTAKGQAETAAQTATEKALQTAQNASQAALDAGRAESAAERAESAETGAGAAKTAAEAAAQSAAASAATADEKSTLAGQSATAAAGSASAAAQSAASIEGDVQIASRKAAEAQTAAGQAVTAKDAAVTAQQGAETAATNSGQSASTATAKASEAAQSASGAAQSKTDAEAAATRAEQAAASLTVDTALSDTSTNPVQNKVITGELTDVKTAISYIENTEIEDYNSRESVFTEVTASATKITGKFVNNVQSNMIRDHASWNYYSLAAQSGDTFNISAYQNGSIKAFYFLDANDTILAYYPTTTVSSLQRVEITATAPGNTAKIYVNENANASDTSHIYKKSGEKYTHTSAYNEWKQNINGLLGVVKTYSNLIDPSAMVNGVIDNAYGDISANTSYKTTDYIPVIAGNPVTFAPRIRVVLGYDTEKNAIISTFNNTTANNGEPYTFTPSADGYVRASVFISDAGLWQCVVGTTVGEPEVYGKYISPDIVVPSANILANKQWAVCGDSFSDGADTGILTEGRYAGEKIVYPYIIGNRAGMNIIKFFQNGRTLAFPAEPGTFKNSLTCPTERWYYQNIPEDVDYITIYLGINDSHHAPGSSGGDGEDNTGAIPLGTIEDATTATYYGAWNVVLTWLLTNRPFAHIGIIVSNGCDTDDYRLAQIAVAKKYGIPYIDLNGDDRCRAMIRSTNPDIPVTVKNIIRDAQAVSYPTNTHPNNAAHQLESTFIEAWLRTL